MDEQQPQDTPRKFVPVTEAQFISVYKYLMRVYAADKDLDTEQMRHVKIQEFVEWCKQTEHPICEEDMRSLPVALEVPRQLLETVWQIFQNPYAACQVLVPLWPVLVLSGQPPCKHQPVCFLFSITAMFNDRTVLQIQAQTPWDTDKPVTDGFLCSLFNAQLNNMIDMIGQTGLDKLWEQYAQPIPERLLGEIRKVQVPSNGTPPQG